MIRRPPRSPLFPYNDALPISRCASAARPARGSTGAAAPGRMAAGEPRARPSRQADRKSTRLNSSHLGISYAVFCLKKKKERQRLEAGRALDLPAIKTQPPIEI